MRLTANYNRRLSKIVNKHLNQPRNSVSTEIVTGDDKWCTSRPWTWLRRRGGTVCSRAAAFGNRSRVRIRVSRSDAHARTSRKSTNVHRGNTEGTPREQRGNSVGLLGAGALSRTLLHVRETAFGHTDRTQPLQHPTLAPLDPSPARSAPPAPLPQLTSLGALSEGSFILHF